MKTPKRIVVGVARERPRPTFREPRREGETNYDQSVREVTACWEDLREIARQRAAALNQESRRRK